MESHAGGTRTLTDLCRCTILAFGQLGLQPLTTLQITGPGLVEHLHLLHRNGTTFNHNTTTH